MGSEFLENEIDVEGQRGDIVDDVDGGPDELPLVGGADEAHQDLKGEPGIANALYVEKGFMCIRPLLVQGPSRPVVRSGDGDILYYRDPHVRMRLEAEGQYGYADEEHTHNSNYLQLHGNREMSMG